MKLNEIGDIVVDCAEKVHIRLDPSLLKSVKDGISRIINGKLE